jgi:hypothetical protein
MSLIEKDLAEAHVYWSEQKAKNGVETVPVDRHLALIEAVLGYEQRDRQRVTAAAEVRDVLEGAAEFNRHHRAVTS